MVAAVFLCVVPQACCWWKQFWTPVATAKRQFGMCLGSVGSGLAGCQTHRWPESQSLFILWLSCSAHSQAPSLSPLPPLSPSLADEDISSCKQDKRAGLKTQQSLRRICHSVVVECLVGCKYAAEEEAKTAKALNKWAHLSRTMPFYCFYYNACWY